MIKGFTLIELMVVIAIIVILATIGVSTYNIVQSSSRDSKRMQDIQEIAKALEQIKTLNGSYNAAPGISDFTSGQIPYDSKATGADDKTVSGCGNTDSASLNYSHTHQCWYCIKSSTTPGFCDTSTDSYIDSAGFYNPTPPATTPTSWLLCTNLERTYNGNSYFCVPNQQ